MSPKLTLDIEAEPIRERLAHTLKSGAVSRQPLIESWPVERFEAQLKYTCTQGAVLSLPFAAALAHFFNHGTHHRGQITTVLTALGQPCPELDLARMLQEDRLLLAAR